MKGKPLRFRVTLHPIDEGYAARVVEFPGCIARGATQREALDNAREALRAFLSGAHLLGIQDGLLEVQVATDGIPAESDEAVEPAPVRQERA